VVGRLRHGRSGPPVVGVASASVRGLPLRFGRLRVAPAAPVASASRGRDRDAWVTGGGGGGGGGAGGTFPGDRTSARNGAPDPLEDVLSERAAGKRSKPAA